MHRVWLVLLVFGLWGGSLLSAWGQDSLSLQDSIERPNLRVLALPLVFYTPDTRWGAGASGLLTFNLGQDTSMARRSSVMPGFAVTTMQQLLVWMPYQLFMGRQRYWISGELDYFRYVYRHFGVGNEIADKRADLYDSRVGRLRVNAMRALGRRLYVGLGYGLDLQENTLRDSSGLMNALQPVGYLGGTMSSLGLVLNFDSRDHINFPTRGWLLKSELKGDHPLVGSDFRCVRLSMNMSRYLSRGKHVWALNGGMSMAWGNPSYFQMSYLGGPERLRGYYEGQYLDHHASWLQAEYRSPLWWRLGAVAFAGVGTVWGRGRAWQWTYLRPNLGAGLRFRLDKLQKVNLRFDYGMGTGARGFYLTFSEAF